MLSIFCLCVMQLTKVKKSHCFCVDTAPTCSMGVDIWSPLMSMLMPMSDVNLDMLEQVIRIMTIIIIMIIILI